MGISARSQAIQTRVKGILVINYSAANTKNKGTDTVNVIALLGHKQFG